MDNNNSTWHHPECEGECIACLIEREVEAQYGTQGLAYLRRHVAAPQEKQEPVGVVATDTSQVHVYYGTQYCGQKTDAKMVMLFKDLPLGTPVYAAPFQREHGIGSET